MEEHESAEAAAMEPVKKVLHVVYALQALSFLVGFTAFVAIIIDYIKRDDAAGTWLESHFRWQIRTFWFALLWSFIGGITTVIGIGVGILFAMGLWLVYRIAKGWLYLNDGRAMYS